ncbi:hypothetical protein EYC84_002094 [Monilinia fructicola]|uniref:Uncharacterized protein n=1 Tax=Monilinia fructicola TaxID=38448 RepID=A0A5M9JUQ2_MONFR|nr:hypothetical protein EYC84_002094 [Monilinia fructicola]
MKAPSSGTAEIESQNKDHESTCVQRELAANPKVSENQSIPSVERNIFVGGSQNSIDPSRIAGDECHATPSRAFHKIADSLRAPRGYITADRQLKWHQCFKFKKKIIRHESADCSGPWLTCTIAISRILKAHKGGREHLQLIGVPHGSPKKEVSALLSYIPVS